MSANSNYFALARSGRGAGGGPPWGIGGRGVPLGNVSDLAEIEKGPGLNCAGDPVPVVTCPTIFREEKGRPAVGVLGAWGLPNKSQFCGRRPFTHCLPGSDLPCNATISRNPLLEPGKLFEGLLGYPPLVAELDRL